jgi:hypothetical protein
VDFILRDASLRDAPQDEDLMGEEGGNAARLEPCDFAYAIRCPPSHHPIRDLLRRHQRRKIGVYARYHREDRGVAGCPETLSGAEPQSARIVLTSRKLAPQMDS